MRSKEQKRLAAKRERERDPEGVRARQRRWKKTHPENVRASSYRNKYGIEYAQVVLLLQAQNTKCAICGNKLTPGTTDCCLDHDHVTLQVRGFLCRKCNLGLGYFRDSIPLCLQVIDYLKRWSHEA